MSILYCNHNFDIPELDQAVADVALTKAEKLLVCIYIYVCVRACLHTCMCDLRINPVADVPLPFPCAIMYID